MNKNEITSPAINYLAELKGTQELCRLLMKTPHYAKMGPEGVFAIVETAKSLNIDPRQALAGGLYFVKGRVEMSSRMMASLVRSKGHSFTKDAKSDDNICILHGKRSDTKDCWTESFSIEEAKRAGIYRGPWQTFPRDMLYARALSRLARQLFPDVIGNCYVQGEIGDDDSIKEAAYQNDSHNDSHNDNQNDTSKLPDKRTKEEVGELLDLLNQLPEYRLEIEEFLQKKDVFAFEEIPKPMYDKVLTRAYSKLSIGKTKDLEEVGGSNDKSKI